MKAALLKLSTVGLLACALANAYADTAAPVIPALAPGFGVSITGLYLQPSASNLVYAVHTTPLPLPAPNWSQQSVQPGYTAAFDLGLLYNLADGTDQVKLDWMHLNTKDTAAAGSSANTSVGPSYYFGPAEQFLLNTTANSTVKFDVNNFNLTFGHFINLTSNIQIEPFVGLSATYLKEDITDNYAGFDPGYNANYAHSVYETSTFSGFGPRLGLDGTYFVTSHFGITAEMAGSLLLGSLTSKTNFTSMTDYTGGSLPHNNTPTDTALADQTQTAVVPEIDGKIGLVYAIPFNDSGSSLTIQGGYMFTTYINAINQVVPTELVPGSWEAGSVAIVTEGQNQSDLDLNGPYLSLAWKF